MYYFMTGKMIMKKSVFILIVITVIFCFICSSVPAFASENVLNFHVFENSSYYKFDPDDLKWEFKHTAYIQSNDGSNATFMVILSVQGKAGDSSLNFPATLIFSKYGDEETLDAVAIAVSPEKGYYIKPTNDPDNKIMIPLTETRDSLVSDLSDADALSIVYSYSSGKDVSFTIQGDEYNAIKEYCQLLLKSNALTGVSPIIVSAYDNMVSVDTVVKTGDDYVISNKEKAVGDAKEYMKKYYCSYDGLIQYLQATYSYEDAKYAADNCGADWKAEALGLAKKWAESKDYSYDGMIESLQYSGFSYDDAKYAADNCNGNWSDAAVQKAKTKLMYSNYSYDGLIKSLQYDGFSYDDAKAATDKCGADWFDQAAKEAKKKLKYSYYSYEGLIKSLQYDDFTYDEAKYGVDLCGANWNQQALGEAKKKLKYSYYSYDGLVGSLRYDDFTYEQAKYGADKCGANWKEQAVGEAKKKLKYSSYTYSDMIKSLQYDGFTYDEAKYGADNCGQSW